MRTYLLILIVLSPFALTFSNAAENDAEKLIRGLHDAASNGDIEAVKAILSQHPECIQSQLPITIRTIPVHTDGYTPLHTAAEHGQVEIVRWLLAHGADLNAPATLKTSYGDVCGSGRTPLEVATASGQFDIVKLLIESKARVHGTSELHLALIGDKVEIAKYLLEHGCKRDLFSAAAMGEFESLKQLLEKHPDVEAHAENGYTALHMAGICGQTETAALLLAAGAKIDTQSEPFGHGDSPLVLAIRFGHGELARYFIEKGADVNLNAGVSPIREAMAHKDLLTLQALLKHKANIEQRDMDGLTPLHAAVADQNGEQAAALLENGADPNAQEEANRYPNSSGHASQYTALDLAVIVKRKALCELVLHFGGKLNKESKENLKEVLSLPSTEPALIRQ